MATPPVNRQLTRGASQGTVFGPLLFNLYINPLVAQLLTVPHVDPLLFADDITVVATGTTAVECAFATQAAVKKIQAWTVLNSIRASSLAPSTAQSPRPLTQHVSS